MQCAFYIFFEIMSDSILTRGISGRVSKERVISCHAPAIVSAKFSYGIVVMPREVRGWG